MDRTRDEPLEADLGYTSQAGLAQFFLSELSLDYRPEVRHCLHTEDVDQVISHLSSQGLQDSLGFLVGLDVGHLNLDTAGYQAIGADNRDQFGVLFLDVPGELLLPDGHGAEEVVQCDGGSHRTSHAGPCRDEAVMVEGETSPQLGVLVSGGDGEVGQATQAGQSLASESESLHRGEVGELSQLGGGVLHRETCGADL